VGDKLEYTTCCDGEVVVVAAMNLWSGGARHNLPKGLAESPLLNAAAGPGLP